MVNLDPYINFKDECEAAMNFYKEILHADLEMTRVGDTPMKEGMPQEMHNQILHSRLSINDQTILFASDGMGYPKELGNSMSLCLSGDLDEIKALWTKFAEGGEVLHEFKEEFFGAFGDLKDKFGVRWMFESNTKPQA